MLVQISLLLYGTAVFVAETAACWRLRRLLALFHKRALISAPALLHDLPSVTVCIPARNERHAMTRCLESILQSRYKKLEILVLDDASVDNTSQLIRAFAKDGVRFIEGSTPPTGWLGKNYALQRLASEASGTYILFLDVDTTLAPSSISQLVSYSELSQANMVSVLPIRGDFWRPSVILAPLRYFWAMLFHSKHRPIAASNAWMVRRKQLLQDFNNFEALRLDIEPEVTIAECYAVSNSYRFLTSKQLLGVQYEKKMSSQIETIMRLRFPQLNYSVVRTLAVAFLMAAIVVCPLVLVTASRHFAILAAAVYIMGFGCYYQYLRFTWERGAILGAWLWPLLLILDTGLTLGSALGYKMKRITWKGRPITTPGAHR